MKESYDARIVMRNGVIPPQSVSPHNVFGSAMIPNHAKPDGIFADRVPSQGPNATKQVPMSMANQKAQQIAIDIKANSNTYPLKQYHYQTQSLPDLLNSRVTADSRRIHPQPQTSHDPFNSKVAIDAKLIQAQSQFGVARGALGTHRSVGTVHYGMS